MGVPLAGNSALPAEQFLYSQASMCGCASLSACISAIFTLIIYQQYKSGFEKITGTQAAVPENVKGMESYFNSIYVVGILQILEACCCFSIVFGIARYFVQSRERNGIRFCCLLDGCCTGWSCVSICSTCSGFIFCCIAASTLANPKEICAQVTTTVPPTLAAGQAAAVECETVVTALQSPVTTTAVWFGFLTLFTCIFVCLCGWGTKSSNDLHNAFEDEEYGGGVAGAGEFGAGYSNQVYY